MARRRYWWDKLDAEQRKAAQFIVDLEGTAALFSEQGTGKTIIALAVLEVLRPKTVVIITPLTSVHLTWAKRLYETFPDYKIVHTLEDYRDVLKRSKRLGAPVRVILVCHYEYLSRRIPRLLRLSFDQAIFDESQALKSRASGWSRAAKRLRRVCKARLIMSGTPVDGEPIDAWAQMRFVDPAVLGDKWANFVTTWCIKGGFMNKVVSFRADRIDDFLRRLKRTAWRLSKDYLNLPPLTIIPVGVHMYGEQRRIYDQFDKNDTITIDGDVINAELTISKNIVKEQITGGYIKTKDGDVIHVGNAKLRKLSVLLKRVDLPVVVFCKFMGEMDGIEERMLEEMRNVRRLDGRVKDNFKKGTMHRTKLIEAFQRGEIDGLICQRKTGGVSIELTRAKHVFLYSTGYSLIDFEQIISRFHRRGQDHEVIVYVLYIIGSIDEEILEVIDEKRSTAIRIVRYLERPTTEE